MSIRKYLSTESINEIVKYSTFTDYSKGHVAFTGAPKKHPYDKDKIILILDPFSSHTLFYEFLIKDIAYVDELPQIVSQDGDSLKMVRIWVKKGSFGVRYEPFVVEDTVTILKDTEFLFRKKDSTE